MNKKILLVILVSILVFSFIAPNALAVAGQSKIGETLYNTLSWMSIDMSKIGAGAGPDNQATFLARFLLWLGIFVVLYYVFHGFIFKGQKNISVAIAAALSIIGVVAIPGDMIRVIFESYSLFFIIAFLALPIVATLYLKKLMGEKVFEEHPAIGRGFNAIAFFLLASIFETMNKFMGSFSTMKAAQFDYQSWIAIAILICNIMLIWNLAALLFSLMGLGGKGKEALQAAKGVAESAGEALEERRSMKAEMAELKLELEEMSFLKKAYSSLGKGKSREAKSYLQKSSMLAERTQRIAQYVELINNHLAGIEGLAARSMERKIVLLQNQILEQTRRIEGLVRTAIQEIDARRPNIARTSVLEALNIEKDQIVPKTEVLEALSIKAYKLNK